MSSLTYKTDADLEAKCALILRQRGYTVEKRKLRITFGTLAKRLRRPKSSLCVKLQGPLCPIFECARGPSGRILWLVPNEALMRFLRK